MNRLLNLCYKAHSEIIRFLVVMLEPHKYSTDRSGTPNCAVVPWSDCGSTIKTFPDYIQFTKVFYLPIED